MRTLNPQDKPAKSPVAMPLPPLANGVLSALASTLSEEDAAKFQALTDLAAEYECLRGVWESMSAGHFDHYLANDEWIAGAGMISEELIYNLGCCSPTVLVDGYDFRMVQLPIELIRRSSLWDAPTANPFLLIACTEKPSRKTPASPKRKRGGR